MHIGIEMAEAFTDLWGVETTLLELQPQLLPRLVDRHFATMLKQHLVDKGVAVHTGESAEVLIEGDPGQVGSVRTGKRTLAADLVVMAVGVRPRRSVRRVCSAGVASRSESPSSGPDGSPRVNGTRPSSKSSIDSG